MFFDQSESEEAARSGLTGERSMDSSAESIAPSGEDLDVALEDSRSNRPGAYERELIQSVWEFAEIVAGNDSALWRKDEFGEWIYRLDYGRRASEFGWEIFDPGIGRHAQGVYAMRPMQWQNYIRQYESFA